MSNHSGSYMLNEINALMGKYNIFQHLGKDETYALIRDIIERSSNYDCNRGEILDGIGRKLGICYSCMKQNKIFKDGLCSECRKPKPKPKRTQGDSEKARSRTEDCLNRDSQNFRISCNLHLANPILESYNSDSEKIHPQKDERRPVS